MKLGESCCDYGAFYEDEGIMPPIHECPRLAPLTDEVDRPLTDLEHDLLRSLNLYLGVRSGRVVDLTGRWR